MDWLTESFYVFTMFSSVIEFVWVFNLMNEQISSVCLNLCKQNSKKANNVRGVIWINEQKTRGTKS
jgi:hypothetical protein